MLEGTYTAIVTPFTAGGQVDAAKLKALINLQAEGGVDGIVPVGTTGESPTLNFEEHNEVIDIAIEPEPLDPDGNTDFDSQQAAHRGIQI